MPGVFGSGLDTLLGRLRRTIEEHGAEAFPSEAIEEAMAAMGKSLRFDPQTVAELVNAAYGKPETFSLLSILYGHVDPSRRFHVDHIFPRARFRRDRLREVGYDEDQIEHIIKQYRDSLANLQLLQGGENIGKSDRLPLDWAREKYADAEGLRRYLDENDMADLPEELDGFLDFYEARRARLMRRLVAVLGREPGSLSEAEQVSADDSETVRSDVSVAGKAPEPAARQADA
jgi:hypothetical protein